VLGESQCGELRCSRRLGLAFLVLWTVAAAGPAEPVTVAHTYSVTSSDFGAVAVDPVNHLAHVANTSPSDHHSEVIPQPTCVVRLAICRESPSAGIAPAKRSP
jgi:hypothetical protein